MSHRQLEADLTYWSLKMSFFKGNLELLLLSPLEDRWQITVIVQSGLPYPVFTSFCWSASSPLCLCCVSASRWNYIQQFLNITGNMHTEKCGLWTKKGLLWLPAVCWMITAVVLMSLCHLCPLVWRTERVCVCVCVCVCLMCDLMCVWQLEWTPAVSDAGLQGTLVHFWKRYKWHSWERVRWTSVFITCDFTAQRGEKWLEEGLVTFREASGLKSVCGSLQISRCSADALLF